MWATANVLTLESGSYATTISWLGLSRDFQGYRVSGENRNQSEFTFVTELNIKQATTYTATASGDSSEFFECRWLAIKLK